MFFQRRQADIKPEIVLNSAEVTPPPVEWIEVEGYKGTNCNMQGYGGYQFELGKTYCATGEIGICKNGFHFCKDIIDALQYHCWELHSRYFKVKATVKKCDYDNLGKQVYVPCSPSRPGPGSYHKENRLVASKITFLEEVSPKEFYPLLGNRAYLPEKSFLRFYQSDKALAPFLKEDFCMRLADNHYSKKFALHLANMVDNNNTSKNVYTLFKKLSFVESRAMALIAEGVGPDMRAYILLKTCE